MKLASFASALMAAGLCLSAIPAADAITPQSPAGYYAVTSILQSLTGTCPASIGVVGDTDVSIFTYPGFAKTGAIDRGIYKKDSTNQLFIRQTTFPTTPAAGVSSWSGSFTTDILPGPNSYSGTFTAHMTVVNGAWVGAFTFTIPSSPTNCTFTLERVFVRTGLLQTPPV